MRSSSAAPFTGSTRLVPCPRSPGSCDRVARLGMIVEQVGPRHVRTGAIEVDRVLSRHGSNPAEGWRDPFTTTELFEPLERRSCMADQEHDRDGVLARVASISFIAALPERDRREVLRRGQRDSRPPRRRRPAGRVSDAASHRAGLDPQALGAPGRSLSSATHDDPDLQQAIPDDGGPDAAPACRLAGDGGADPLPPRARVRRDLRAGPRPAQDGLPDAQRRAAVRGLGVGRDGVGRGQPAGARATSRSSRRPGSSASAGPSCATPTAPTPSTSRPSGARRSTRPRSTARWRTAAARQRRSSARSRRLPPAC